MQDTAQHVNFCVGERAVYHEWLSETEYQHPTQDPRVGYPPVVLVNCPDHDGMPNSEGPGEP